MLIFCPKYLRFFSCFIKIHQFVPKIQHILSFLVSTFKITNEDPGDYKLQNGKNIMLNTTEQMSPKSFKKAKIPWKPNSKTRFSICSTWFFDKNGGIYHREISRNFLLFFLLIWTLALQYLFMRWRENFSKLFCHHYLVSMLQVQNDTTIHCCVKLLEGRNRGKATEFTDLFVSWQPVITTSVNDVSESIFVKI